MTVLAMAPARTGQSPTISLYHPDRIPNLRQTQPPGATWSFPPWPASGNRRRRCSAPGTSCARCFLTSWRPACPANPANQVSAGPQSTTDGPPRRSRRSDDPPDRGAILPTLSHGSRAPRSREFQQDPHGAIVGAIRLLRNRARSGASQSAAQPPRSKSTRPQHLVLPKLGLFAAELRAQADGRQTSAIIGRAYQAGSRIHYAVRVALSLPFHINR